MTAPKGNLHLYLVHHLMRVMDELMPPDCEFTLVVSNTKTGECDVLSKADPAVTYELFAQLSSQHPDRVRVIGG